MVVFFDLCSFANRVIYKLLYANWTYLLMHRKEVIQPFQTKSQMFNDLYIIYEINNNIPLSWFGCRIQENYGHETRQLSDAIIANTVILCRLFEFWNRIYCINYIWKETNFKQFTSGACTFYWPFRSAKCAMNSHKFVCRKKKQTKKRNNVNFDSTWHLLNGSQSKISMYEETHCLLWLNMQKSQSVRFNELEPVI